MLIKPHLLRLPRLLRLPATKSTMSTTTPQKYDWLCIMPDKPDALERRLKARPHHFENLKPLVESKFINFGGAYLDEPPEDGKQLTFRGSVLTCVAESKEEVVKVLKEDPYTLGDVWDWEKVQIYPLKVALRTALEN